MAWLGILLIVILLLLLVAAVLGVYWALYRWLQRRWGKGASNTLLVLTFLAVVYGMRTFSYYNSEGFYRKEYERVTLRPFPESGQLESRTDASSESSASFQTFAQLKVPPQEYQRLQKQLAQDARFVPYPCLVSRLRRGWQPFGLDVESMYACSQYAHGYARRDQSQLLYIGFVTDGRTLVILCLDPSFIPSGD